MNDDESQLDLVFGALANGTRRAMLARLADGPATVNELAEPFDLSLPAVSKHVRVLERAGLIVQGREAQYRPCSIEPTSLRLVSDWVEHYRPIWEDRFDRMADYLERLRTETGSETGAAGGRGRTAAGSDRSRPRDRGRPVAHLSEQPNPKPTMEDSDE